MIGVAGPAIAAALMLMLRRANVRLLPGLFLLLLAIGWVVLMLADSSKVGLRALDWNPLLILPALLPALSGAFFVGAAEIRWPGWRWPLIAALAMPAFLLIPAFVAHFVSLPIIQPRREESMPIAISAAAVLFVKQLLFAGLLEEPGWRGWLLPRLQRRFSPLVSSLFVWFPWALWHAPLDFTGSVGRTWLNYLQLRLVFFIPITILLTWLYNRSRGSILVVALFHAGFNTFPFVLPYSPPFMVLIFVWAALVLIADRMWCFQIHPTISTKLTPNNSKVPPKPEGVLDRVVAE